MCGDRTRFDCKCTRPPLFKAPLPTILRSICHDGQTTEELATAEGSRTEKPTNGDKLTTTEEFTTVTERTTEDTFTITENTPSTKESAEQWDESIDAEISSEEIEAIDIEEPSASEENAMKNKYRTMGLISTETPITDRPIGSDDTSTVEKLTTEEPPTQEQTITDKTPTETHASTTTKSTMMSTEPITKMLPTVSLEFVPELGAPDDRGNMKDIKTVVGSIAGISVVVVVVVVVVLVVQFRESCRRRLGHYLSSHKPEDNSTIRKSPTQLEL